MLAGDGRGRVFSRAAAHSPVASELDPEEPSPELELAAVPVAEPELVEPVSPVPVPLVLVEPSVEDGEAVVEPASVVSQVGVGLGETGVEELVPDPPAAGVVVLDVVPEVAPPALVPQLPVAVPVPPVLVVVEVVEPRPVVGANTTPPVARGGAAPCRLAGFAGGTLGMATLPPGALATAGGASLARA